MVEGVHPRILETFLRRPAVPAFPDSCRTVFDRKHFGALRMVIMCSSVIIKSLAKLSTFLDRQELTHELVICTADVHETVPSY